MTYFTDHSHVSRSMLALLRESPRTYEARYITGTMPPEPPSESMQVGTAIHAEVLLGQSVVRTCPPEYLAQNGAMSTAAAKQWREEAVAAGYAVLRREAGEKIAPTVASVLRRLESLGNPHTAQGAVIEREIYWKHASGVKVKAKPDLITPGAVIDLKTISELSQRKVESAIADHGYWLQAAHYTEAAKQLGFRPQKFIFLFAETQAPWRCWMRELDAEYLDWAFVERERLLDDLARRMAENDWADPGENELVAVKKPRYME